MHTHGIPDCTSTRHVCTSRRHRSVGLGDMPWQGSSPVKVVDEVREYFSYPKLRHILGVWASMKPRRSCQKSTISTTRQFTIQTCAPWTRREKQLLQEVFAGTVREEILARPSKLPMNIIKENLDKWPAKAAELTRCRTLKSIQDRTRYLH